MAKQLPLDVEEIVHEIQYRAALLASFASESATALVHPSEDALIGASMVARDIMRYADVLGALPATVLCVTPDAHAPEGGGDA
jgi:hypothetical protein